MILKYTFQFITSILLVYTIYHYIKKKRIKKAAKIFNDKIPNDWRPNDRKYMLEMLEKDQFDLLIIGAGSSGAGCALDAITRGLKVAIIDSYDICAETSSKCTKLLHGGVRYLDKAISKLCYQQLKIVLHALYERSIVCEMIPFLSYTIQIIVPLYEYWKMPYYWLLLKLYDKLSCIKALGRSELLNKKKTILHFANLDPNDLKGSVKYYDCMFDDARANVLVVVTAAAYGAIVGNYIKLIGLNKNGQGIVESAICEDKLSNKKFKIKAKGYISTVGAFTDKIHKFLDKKTKDTMIHSSGTHIILPPEYKPENMGFVNSHTKDDRMIFILPWKNKTLVGSTDNPCKLEAKIVPKEEEINFLIKETEKYLGKEIKKSEVLAAWTGIRPLVKDGKSNNTESIVRDYQIKNTKKGLISLTGGKWTIFRKMSEETIDLAIKEFELKPSREGITKYLAVIGSEGYTRDIYYKLDEELKCGIKYAKNLISRYGSRAFLMKKYLFMNSEKLSKKYEFFGCEVIYAIENEFACTIEDILKNRFMIGLYDVFEASKMIVPIGKIMAKHFNWDKNKLKNEIEKAQDSLNKLGLNYVLKHSVKNK